MKKLDQIKRTIVCIFILSSFSFLTNCEKENAPDSDMKEFVNPMEFVGVLHNQGIDYILENYKHSESPVSLEDQVIKLANSFISSYQDNELVYNSTFDYDELGIMVLEDLEKKRISFEIDFSNKFGRKSLDFYNALLDIISENINSASQLYAKVNELETEINYSSLSDENKYVLLTACSVGRHSYNYWDEFLKTNNLSFSVKGDLIEELLNVDIKGSIIGAIGGAIIGAIYGSVILPGAGTITAAIAEGIHGGIYGAVLSSAFRLLEEIV